MTQAVDHLSPPRGRWSDFSLVGGISLAHLVSHFHMLVLPPLIVFVKEDFGVTYTEIGLAISLFNFVSMVFQIPVGFLVDRVGARANLIGGLAIAGAALVCAGLVHSYWMLVAMFGVLGIANSVYHPADYSLLSQHVASDRIAQAFSVHTFAGLLGGALAPITVLYLQGVVGWRGALTASGLFAFIAAAVLLMQRDQAPRIAVPPRSSSSGHLTGWRLLLSGPILLNLLFFILMSMISGGLTNYLVVALAELHHTSLAVANNALTVTLATSAVGVLIGGALLLRTSRHALVAVVSFVVIAVTAIAVGLVDFGALGLIVLMAINGLAGGVMAPSRDMIVRAVTPPGAFGAVFGFVTNGFSMAGIISPLIYGYMMDRGQPQLIFLVAAGFALLCAVVVIIGARRQPVERAAV